MGAFVEVQPRTAKQPANILPLDSLHSTNSLEISLNYSFVKHQSLRNTIAHLFWGKPQKY